MPRICRADQVAHYNHKRDRRPKYKANHCLRKRKRLKSKKETCEERQRVRLGSFEKPRRQISKLKRLAMDDRAERGAHHQAPNHNRANHHEQRKCRYRRHQDKTRDPPKGSRPTSNKRLQTKPVQRFGRIIECCIENKQNEKKPS